MSLWRGTSPPARGIPRAGPGNGHTLVFFLTWGPQTPPRTGVRNFDLVRYLITKSLKLRLISHLINLNNLFELSLRIDFTHSNYCDIESVDVQPQDSNRD